MKRRSPRPGRLAKPVPQITQVRVTPAPMSVSEAIEKLEQGHFDQVGNPPADESSRRSR